MKIDPNKKAISAHGKCSHKCQEADITQFHGFDDGCSFTTIQKTAHRKRGVALSQARILLAEDDLSNQKIVEFSLRKKVNCIDIVGNGMEAVKRFQQSHYDLILMDLHMPIMGGVEACQQIRGIEADTDIKTPIIAITASNSHSQRERAMDAGMTAFLSKPFMKSSLINLIEEYL